MDQYLTTIADSRNLLELNLSELNLLELNLLELTGVTEPYHSDA